MAWELFSSSGEGLEDEGTRVGDDGGGVGGVPPDRAGYLRGRRRLLRYGERDRPEPVRASGDTRVQFRGGLRMIRLAGVRRGGEREAAHQVPADGRIGIVVSGDLAC
ncbi:MAG TPA: hypothetical protein VF070_21665 [Streptosporangiaceae bacterium]